MKNEIDIYKILIHFFFLYILYHIFTKKSSIIETPRHLAAAFGVTSRFSYRFFSFGFPCSGVRYYPLIAQFSFCSFLFHLHELSFNSLL